MRSASEHRQGDDGKYKPGLTMSVTNLVANLGCDSVSSDTDSGCSLTLPSWRGSLSLSWEAGRELIYRDFLH